MSQTMNISEARAALPAVLDRVMDGEQITITRYGQPVAVVVSPSVLTEQGRDEMLAVAGWLRDLRRRAASIPLDQAPTMSQGRADELVAQIREDRDSGR